MKFAERELEDYIWENPDSLKHLMHFAKTEKSPKPVIRLGRQVRCDAGIIDLLFMNYTDIYIIELKNGRAGDKEFGQLSRYSEHVRQQIYHTHLFGDDGNISKYVGMWSDIRINRMLIATCFDDLLEWAEHETNHLIKVAKVEDRFEFSPVWTPHFYPTGELQTVLAPFYKLMVKTYDELY